MANEGKISWTDQGLKGFKSNKRRLYPDPKCKGLNIRVSPTGSKVWYLIYRRKGSNQPKHLIGEFGHGSDQFTLVAARREADRLRGEIAQGRDPAREQSLLAKAESVSQLLDQYMSHHKKPNAAWTRESARIFEKDVKPIIGHYRIPELARPHVRQVLDSVKSRGVKTTVNRTLAALRRAFQWAVEQDILITNPASNIKTGIEETPKDRALNESEIQVLWTGLDRRETPMGPQVRLAAKLVLLTAQRPGEVSGAGKSELDFNASLWHLPASRSKNGKPHTVPLHPMAVELFKEAMAIDTDSEFVFGVRSRAVKKIEKITQAMERHALSKGMVRARNHLGLSNAPATPHDLRRTAATHMARLGIPKHYVAAVLNHGSSDKRSVTERVYIQHDYLPEKTAALMAWGNELQRLVQWEAPNGA